MRDYAKFIKPLNYYAKYSKLVDEVTDKVIKFERSRMANNSGKKNGKPKPSSTNANTATTTTRSQAQAEKDKEKEKEESMDLAEGKEERKRKKDGEGSAEKRSKKKNKLNRSNRSDHTISSDSDSEIDMSKVGSDGDDEEDDIDLANVVSKSSELKESISHFEKVKKDLMEGKKMTDKDLHLMLVEQILESKTSSMELLRENERLNREIRHARKERQDLQKQIERLKLTMEKPEIVAAKRGIIVRGVEERPTAAEDKNRFMDMMQSRLQLKPETVEMSTRLPINRTLEEKLKKEGKQIRRPILLRFHNVNQKFDVLKNLPNLQSWEEGRQIRVSNDVPMCLRGRNRNLENQGRSIRANDKEMRTRVVYEGLALKLQAKKKGEKIWTLVDDDF